MAHYADTSALAKLVLAEPETRALRKWLKQADRTLVSCDLTRTELTRATRRASPDLVVVARTVLDSITLIQVTPATFETAGRLEPPTLRSLYAVHLAAALDLGDDLETFVTYDDRLSLAAKLNGIPTTSPS